VRKPDWLKTRLATGAGFDRVNAGLAGLGLHTVCSQARCPNLDECWNAGTATFLVLGDTCTRRCRFCSVPTGNPQGALDPTEPERVAAAVAELGINYAVVTSVDRDDLADLGAGAFAATVRAVKRQGVAVEVLTPDFGGREDLIAGVVAAGPDVFGHNIETVERVTPRARDPRASYRASLGVLAAVKRLDPGVTTKSGLMLGLGETDDEVEQALADLRSVECDVVTIGQYLQPDRRCLPVERYVPPGEFARWQERAVALGFAHAFCGPLVRSSYRAAEVAGPDKSEAKGQEPNVKAADEQAKERRRARG
jgi:lipoic acid synthetase